MSASGSEDKGHDQETADWAAWGGLFVLALLFGSSFYWNVLILSHYDAWAGAALRFISGGVFLTAVALITGAGLPRTQVEWGWCAIYGVLAFAFPFTIVAHVQTVVPSNVVAIFFAAIPLLILAMSSFFLAVPITARKWVGCAIGTAGLIYMAGPGTLSQLGGRSAALPVLGTLLAVSSLAYGAIVIRRMPPMPATRTAAGATLLAGIAGLPMLFLSGPVQAPTVTALIGIIGGGIATTGLGQLLRVALLRRKGPVFITPNAYLAAIVGVILGVVLLGEQITVETIIAGCVLLAGILIAQDGSGRMARQ